MPGGIYINSRLRQGGNSGFEKLIALEDQIFEKPQRSQRTQRKWQSSVFSECSVVLDSFSRIKSKCIFYFLTDDKGWFL